MNNRLRELRKAAGLSQELLSEKAGLSVSYAGLLERGERRINEETAQSLATALGCRPADLFVDTSLPNDINDFLTKLLTMSLQDREEVYRFADLLTMARKAG